ncbi:hypothetical protein CO009_02765 [Candidatus Shapirobacteria bacterium CG_4_8_14_3_um_filter_35_11]|uniref:DUF86 domain-containing protein n=2 Tax=Candidatus Shapironibacteriota TaxID=1752721 RepID=A0A2M7AS27_9BACT|nr:MAG: hypothetical protein COS78_02755 [Candidatus Shapirobacteria bacterium CG06_land_8_20_14_3_00_40_12]PJC80111.1 MAG: hypothetical protein CO009_02765 [Candidatus Shapirobacteria bacterium CG_4_8_14_3_um_filter_35_11]
MKIMKTDFVYLQQINDFINEIESYIGNIGFDDFAQSGLLQDAVVRKIELIGESAKRLSLNFWKKYKNELPLAQAVSTRNRMIHQYDDIDLKIVWNTIKNDLPDLKKKIKEII